MGICYGKKQEPQQETEVQIKQKELDQLNCRNFQIIKDIAAHKHKNEMDKAQTKEWELQQNQGKIDELKKQIQKLKICGNSLQGASERDKREFQQQVNKTLS